PIGVYCRNDLGRLRLLARASALVTHAHPTALVAAEATALCVGWAAQGIPPSEYADRIRDERPASVKVWTISLGDCWKRANFATPENYLNAGWIELLTAFDRVQQALSQDAADICEVLGGGWVAEEALACALACVLKSPQDYPLIVRRGANTGGDSDSIASIAGAIGGAFLG